MSEERKSIGAGKLSKVPDKRLRLTIGDGAVKTEHIANGAITSQKVSPDAVQYITADVQNQIDSIQIGGWAISNNLGNDPHIGISQKALTELIGYNDYPNTIRGRIKTAEDNIQILESNIDNCVKNSEKGEASGIATLDSNGKVPQTQLPSYVDDVIEGYYYNSAFYADENHTQLLDAETGKIYVDVPSKVSYRYSGSAYVAISNPYIPDEEDLTVTNDTVRFKDKTYNSLSYSGLGRKMLRKNMVESYNVLTQDMVNIANTIYIIQYDYVLGSNITIPANCILQFEGGSIRNAPGFVYKVTGTKTHINTDVAYNIFSDTLGSGFELPYIDIRWVGGVSDWDGTSGTDNHDAFKFAVDTIGKYYDGMYVYIVGQYYIGTSVSTIYNVNIWGCHNNSRHLLPGSEMASVSSPSMIVVGENIGIYMPGRTPSGSTTAYAYFTLKNIQVKGLSTSSSEFIYYVASGSPSRVCVVEECEFSGFKNVFKFVASKDTVIGNLTISKCDAYYNSKFIYAVPDQDTTHRTLCNCVIKDSTIEQNGANCIYMDRAFSSIIIDNNILEGQPSPIYIKQTSGDVTISNNYFEANTGDAITISSYNSNMCRVHLNSNFYDSSISVNIRSVMLFGSLQNLSDSTRISNCYVEDIDNYKLSWLEGGQYGSHVVFDKFKTGINYRTPGSMTYTMRQGNIIGREAPTTLGGVAVTESVVDTSENLIIAFYSNGHGTLGFYKNASGYQSSYSTFGLRNGGLVIFKALPYATGVNDFLIKNETSGKVLSMLGFYDESTSPAYILVPDANTPVRSTSRPSFPDMPVGYGFFDKENVTPNRMIWYKGSNVWVDATGATV